MRIGLAAVNEASHRVRALMTSGWIISDSDVGIEATSVGLAPTSRLRQLAPAADLLTSFTANGTFGDFEITLRLINGTLEVESCEPGDIELTFADATSREAARAAAQHNAASAETLPLDWRVRAVVSLSKLAGMGGVEIRAVLSRTWLVDRITEAGPAGIGYWLPTEGRRLYVALDDTTDVVHFGLASFSGNIDSVVVPDHDTGSLSAISPSAEIVPDHVAPLGPPCLAGQWSEVSRVFGAALIATVWRIVANTTSADGLGIEIVGFKRLAVKVPEPSQLRESDVVGTASLSNWIRQDVSPDRLLAVRQVASLYADADVLQHPQEVLESAEVIFVGLRGEAVAEALRSARDAQAASAESVRQTLKSAQELTKNSTDRVLASLVSIGAIVVTNSTRDLSDETGRLLLLFIAGFLVFLAVVSLVIDGPSLALPIRTLRDDLKHGSPLLSDGQRDRATSLPSLAAVKQRIILVRVATPLVYASVAASIIMWGHPTSS